MGDSTAKDDPRESKINTIVIQEPSPKLSLVKSDEAVKPERSSSRSYRRSNASPNLSTSNQDFQAILDAINEPELRPVRKTLIDNAIEKENKKILVARRKLEQSQRAISLRESRAQIYKYITQEFKQLEPDDNKDEELDVETIIENQRASIYQGPLKKEAVEKYLKVQVKSIPSIKMESYENLAPAPVERRRTETFDDIIYLPEGLRQRLIEEEESSSPSEHTLKSSENQEEIAEPKQLEEDEAFIPEISDFALKGTGSDVPIEGANIFNMLGRTSVSFMLFAEDSDKHLADLRMRLDETDDDEPIKAVSFANLELTGPKLAAVREEEEEVEPKEVEEKIDRSQYLMKYMSLERARYDMEVANYFLHKALVLYYKKRRMDHHVIKPVENWENELEKYLKRLDAYDQLLDIKKMETCRLTEDINSLKAECKSKRNDVQKLFIKLQNRETDVGRGLIYTKTGNVISDKVVDTLTHRQKNQCQNLAEIRLQYIKLCHKTKDVQEKIKRVNQVCESDNLNEFSQLKLINTGFREKLEEKVLDISRLNEQFKSVMHKRTDIRQKFAVNDKDIVVLRQKSKVLDDSVLLLRQHNGEMKGERDHLRNAYMKIKEDSGLLLHPTLLRDFESSLELQTKKQQELKHLVNMMKKRSEQIVTIRENIATEKVMMVRKRTTGMKRRT